MGMGMGMVTGRVGRFLSGGASGASGWGPRSPSALLPLAAAQSAHQHPRLLRSHGGNLQTRHVLGQTQGGVGLSARNSCRLPVCWLPDAYDSGGRGGQTSSHSVLVGAVQLALSLREEALRPERESPRGGG